MDHHIQNFKYFIDGLGSHNVEFPDRLTPQEVNLIVELFVTAAQTETQGTSNGFEKLLGILWKRINEELGGKSTHALLKMLTAAEAEAETE